MEPTNQIPVQQTPTQNVVSLPSKPQFNWYKIATIGLLLLITIGAGAFWMGRRTTNNLSDNQNQEVQISSAPNPTLIKNDKTANQTCQTGSYCKLIYNNCDCEAVNINDTRTQSDKDNDKVCKINQCSGVTPPASAVCVNNLCQVANWFQLITQRKSDIINKSGTAAVDIRPTKSELFYKDVYVVSWAFIDQQGNQIPTGGGYGLVGPVNNQLELSLPQESQYCSWLKASDKDEATKAFMEVEECK